MNGWILSLIRREIEEFVYDRCASVLTFPAKERLCVLHIIVNCLERTALEKLDSLASVYYSLGRLTFEKAVSLFKEELSLIYDCRPYLDRALY
jgi:hypothetical protein